VKGNADIRKYIEASLNRLIKNDDVNSCEIVLIKLSKLCDISDIKFFSPTRA